MLVAKQVQRESTNGRPMVGQAPKPSPSHLQHGPMPYRDAPLWLSLYFRNNADFRWLIADSRPKSQKAHRPWSHPRYPPLVFGQSILQPLLGRRVARHVVRRVDMQFHATFSEYFGHGGHGHPHTGYECHG